MKTVSTVHRFCNGRDEDTLRRNKIQGAFNLWRHSTAQIPPLDVN